MFYNYEILKENNEDVLYLYLTMKYEFSKELIYNNESDLERRCKNFIQMNNIPYKGNKVYLVVDGIVVKSININKVKVDSFPSIDYSANHFMLNIRLQDNSYCEISLKEYLLSILFSYYHPALSSEVLKCISILFNTYCYKMMNEYKVIEENNEFAYYRPLSYYKELYSNYSDISIHLNSIIDEVDSIFLQYHNSYILPFIHYSNNGKTLLNPKYPYLSSVKSLWDILSPDYIHYVDYSYDDLENLLKIKISNKSKIEIRGNYVQRKIVIDQNIFSIEEIKSILNLSSLDYYFIIYNDYIRIISFGFGNSYGLSIFGSNEIAKNGGKYQNILYYYFPKVKIYRYIKELS